MSSIACSLGMTRMPADSELVDPAAIEARASRVLAAVPDFVWNGDELPIPVEDIVDSCYGLLVRDVEDMSAAPVPGGLESDEWISGLLLAARGEIWVNAEDARRWPPRRRFTISHELGHWELHRTGQQTLFCRGGHVEPAALSVGSTDPGPPRPLPEEEADVFAAAMLMPAHLVVAQRRECGDDVAELCRRFDCSEKAMRRRLLTV
jgi:IrrE N-terminal-like domain